MDNQDELCWVHSIDGALLLKDVYSYAIASIEFASYSKELDPMWHKL